MAATKDPRPCSIADALTLVGEKYSLLVLREVCLGNGRFDQLVRNIGAPRDILATRLRRLVDAGILTKRVYSERPGCSSPCSNSPSPGWRSPCTSTPRAA